MAAVDGGGLDAVDGVAVGADGVGADAVGADGTGADGTGADGTGADETGADGTGADGVGVDAVGVDGDEALVRPLDAVVRLVAGGDGAIAAPPSLATGGPTACTVVLSWDACWTWLPPSQCDTHVETWT